MVPVGDEDGAGLAPGPAEPLGASDGSSDGSSDGPGGMSGLPRSTDGSGPFEAGGTLPSGPLLLPHAATTIAAVASRTATTGKGR